MTRQATIIIPTMCQPERIQDILSIQKYLPEWATLVVSANTFDWLAAHELYSKLDPRHFMLFVPRPTSYIEACNAGFHIAPSSFFIGTLNDDVEASGDWLTPLVEALDAGAVQAGPSLKWLSREGTWGSPSDTGRQFLEGWCWLARAKDLPYYGLYDTAYSQVYCEDCDLSLAFSTLGPLAQVDVPLVHKHSCTYGSHRPTWAANRKTLISRWGLDNPR